MSKFTFKDVKDVIEYNSDKKYKGYGFPLLSRFNTIVGNIESSQVHVVAGLPSSGVTSFIDQNYVMSILLQWYNTQPEDRKHLKIFYYSMKDNEMKKLQLLLCNYLKLVEGLRTDIPTLNSQVGKLYEIKNDKVLQNAIDDSELFFNEIIDEEVLVIKDGQYKPTDIYNDVMNYMESIGDKGSDKSYVLKDEYTDALVLVIVDPVENLSPDNDGYGVVMGPQLHDKFQRQIRNLKLVYGVSFVLAVPAVTGYVRSTKDTEPSYKQLGSYGPLADKGIVIYNPIAENNIKFYNGEPDPFVSPKGNILMRTWHVVRNTDGIESVYDRMLFLPGTSYLVEHDFTNKVDDIDDVLDILEKDTCFKI